jgi:FkbM family methyltransferase
VLPKVANAGKIETLGDGREVQIMHNGVMVKRGGYHGAWMEEIIRRLGGHHEPQEERIFHEIVNLVPSDGIMVECGCSWGYYSLWFLHGHPQRKTFMLEPVKADRALAEENFEINGRSIKIDPYYIAAQTTATPFTDWDNSIIPDVTGISIDDYLTEKNITHLNILHADIQGAEEELLKGAQSTLGQKKVDYIVISTHGECHEPCIAKIKDYGYKIWVSHTIAESVSADGLIVAYNPNLPPPPSVTISKHASI